MDLVSITIRLTGQLTLGGTVGPFTISLLEFRQTDTDPISSVLSNRH